ncbi:MAG: hypothetical protein D6761_05105 [Candidatus Dadabacteria bacterium]|nr:MAG: hypothetical protein D6761_05105 [Candidatus Dadabacteria bacterium]
MVSLAVLVSASATASGFDPDGWKVRQSRMVERNAEVVAGDRTLQVRVYTEPEHQEWGRQVAEWTTRLLAVAIRRHGVPSGLDTVLVIEEPSLPSAGWNGRKHGLRLKYPAGPVVLAEQIAHFWFHPGTVADAWLMKGLARYEGWMFLRAAGFGDDVREAVRLDRNLLLTQRGQLDRPLEGVKLYEQSRDGFAYLCAKAAAFVAAVAAVVGSRGWDAWIRDTATAKRPVEATALAGLLKSAGSDPDALLSGWVRTGAYRQIDLRAFQDQDRDDLADGLEPMLGTSPERTDSDGDQLSDGFEYWYGFNPVDRDSDGDGRPDQAPDRIAVDGLAGDWEQGFPHKVYRDKTGESREFDIQQVAVGEGENGLFVRVDPAGQINPAAAFWVQVQLDFDGDRRADLLVIADDRNNSWATRIRTGAAPPSEGRPQEGLVARWSQVFELAIPAVLYADARKPAVNVQVTRPGATAVIDHTGSWWQPVRSQP